MKTSRTIAAALALLFVVSVLTVSVQAAPGMQGKKQDPKAAAKAPAKSGMPKEIAAVIQEGLATRQGRQDIPFSFFKQLVLPARDNNLYPVFFVKAKNGDLGYAPSASGSGDMETNLVAFFQFFEPAADGTMAPKMGGKSQVALTTPGADYSPDKEDWYSFGLGMPAGKYTLAMVLSTPDMKKLSVAYTDVTLNGPAAYETALWPTDPVIVTAMEQGEQDQRPTLHRGYFTWGAIKFSANVTGEIATGQDLEVFFFVLGAAYKDPAAARPELDLEVSFEVQDEAGKSAIKWAPQTYQAYFVNQPLPLVQTLQKMDEKGTVLSTEKKPLGAGKYGLVATITDKVSGKKGEARMGFTVK
ncbi:MAG: hypothetical protein KA243_04445 [Candidatus Aminicenantes bacterium]|nr:hypothetical protein [Candidatus Aminicenantes bacterium]